MSNPMYQTPPEYVPSQRLCQAAIFLVALLLVVGLTQLIDPPFESDPEYNVTLQDGFAG